MRFPLSHEDMSNIAKQQKRLERVFFDKEGNYKENANYVGKIEVLRPDGDDVIGHFILEDGWLGFEFLEKS